MVVGSQSSGTAPNSDRLSPLSASQNQARSGLSRLNTEMLAYGQKHWTGTAIVRSSDRQVRHFWMWIGRIVWANGGRHPHRRLRRQFLRHGRPIDLSSISIVVPEGAEANYLRLVALYKQEQITFLQLKGAIAGVASEVLFDLYRDQWNGSPEFSIEWQEEALPSPDMVIQPSWGIPIPRLCERVSQEWEAWQRSNLAECDPDLAPQLRRHRQLQEQTSPSVYANLSKLANGKRSLRDIAASLDDDLTKVARSLYPFVQQGSIGLDSIPDLAVPVARAAVEKVPESRPIAPSPDAPLVVCIEDNPAIAQVMEQILNQGGYRALSIQDTSTVIPTLMEQEPQFIFLDMTMPELNGYELCNVIRRTSTLKDIPIAIASSRKNPLERARVRLAGADGFVGKPLDKREILAILQRYVPLSGK